MEIKTITKSFSFTYNLGDYSNIKPSTEICAVVDTDDDPQIISRQLAAIARNQVEQDLDSILEDMGRAPYFYKGQRYALIEWKQLDNLLLLVKDEACAAITYSRTAPGKFKIVTSRGYPLDGRRKEKLEEFVDADRLLTDKIMLEIHHDDVEAWAWERIITAKQHALLKTKEAHWGDIPRVFIAPAHLWRQIADQVNLYNDLPDKAAAIHSLTYLLDLVASPQFTMLYNKLPVPTINTIEEYQSFLNTTTDKSKIVQIVQAVQAAILDDDEDEDDDEE